MKLKVSNESALAELQLVPHAHCQSALQTHWQVSDDGEVRAASVLWLFCWAKTGQGSAAARTASRLAFDRILPVSFEEFDSQIPHDWARQIRYRPDVAEQELPGRLFVRAARAHASPTTITSD